MKEIQWNDPKKWNPMKWSKEVESNEMKSHTKNLPMLHIGKVAKSNIFLTLQKQKRTIFFA